MAFARALTATAISVVALPAIATVAIGAAGLSSAPAGATNSPLTCAPGTIYNLTTSGAFDALNTSTSADTPAAPSSLGAGEQTPNALAISADGVTAYTADQNNTGTGGGSDTTTVDMENVQTAANQSFTNMPATGIGADDLIAGGVDPVNGDYYYGGWNDAGTAFDLFAFNPTTHTAAEAGTVTPANGGTWASGDLAFDGSGNLYVLAGSTDSASGTGEILTVAGPIPTSGTAALTNKVLSSFSGHGNIDGVAFAADGTLYSEDFSGDLNAINPNSGVVTPLAHQSGVSSPDDLASCAFNGSLKLQKDVVGRVGANDQFTVSIAQGSTILSTGTTSGTGTGTQTGASEIAGPVVGIPSTQYTISETGASGANLANYASSYSCLNGTTSFASGSGTSALLPAFPAASGASGAQIVCTFTNTPASISLTKTPSPTSVSSAGQHVTYTFAFTNTGPVTLTNVDVTDAQTAPSSNANLSAIGNCVVGSTPETNGSITLAAGASGSCTATYTVQAADLTQGSIADTGTVTGTAPGGGTVSAKASASVSVTANPSISIAKGASVSSIAAPGTITYTFTVTNTGNVGLTAADVTDSLNTGTLGTIACTGLTNPTATCSGDSVALAPGQVATFSATLAVTQAMIDAGGKITDTGSVSANTPTGVTPSSVSGTSNQVNVSIVQNPALTTTKTVTSTGPYNTVGQAVTYNFAVKNTGNVDISNVGVSDVPTLTSGPTCTGLVNPTATCSGSTVATLAPGQTANFSGTYDLTQADLDNGSVSDTGTACGTAPNASAPTCSNGSTVIVTTQQNPSLSIVKSASPGVVHAPGQVITYTFDVTNTGNVTINGIKINDTQEAPASQGNLSTPVCPQSSLAPKATENCTATYTVTSTDLFNGSITDSATASGTTKLGTPVTSPPSMATVLAVETVMSGRAYALSLGAGTPGVAAVGPMTVQDTGGTDTALSTTTPNPCEADLNVLDVAITGDVCASVTTSADNPETSTASSSIANAAVSIGAIPVIKVQAVQSTSTTTCAGSNGSVTIAYLAVGNTVLINKPTQIAPNTGFNVGIVSLVLNQQTPFSLGGDHGLTVYAVHAQVTTGLLNANVVVAASISDIDCATPFASPLLTGEASVANLTASALGKSVLGDITVNDSGPILTQTPYVTPTPCVATAHVLDIAFTGDACAGVNTTASNSTATASVANASLAVPNVVPTIVLKGVQSQSTTSCNGSTGSVTIVYLKVGNTVVINSPEQVAPNTKVVVGTVTLLLNKQTPFSIGGDTGLTVNAIAVSVNGGAAATANLTIANSTSDIIGCH